MHPAQPEIDRLLRASMRATRLGHLGWAARLEHAAIVLRRDARFHLARAQRSPRTRRYLGFVDDATETRTPAMTPMKYSAAFVFEGGSLTIKRSGRGTEDGGGHFAFSDDDLQYEQDDCSSKVSRWINVNRDDLVELRDFLNKELPPA